MGLQTDRAWAAGIIDADGCITIKRARRGTATYYQLQVIVAQSGDPEPPTITKLRELFGGNVDRDTRERRPNRQPRWTWQAAASTAEATLRAVQPYLIGKRDQADAALEYRATALGRGKRSLAESYYHRLREMKHYQPRTESDHEQEAEAHIRR